MNNNKKTVLIGAAALLALGLSFWLPLSKNQQNSDQNNANAVNRTDFTLRPLLLAPLRSVSILATAALVVDLATGDVLYEKNADIILPLASLTKIISSLVLLDRLPLDEVVTISEHAIATEGISVLVAGERYRVRDLLIMAMIESSNDAVAALMEYVAYKENIAPAYRELWFVGQMRNKVLALGASQKIIFYNPTGLDISDRLAGAYGSARDIVRIAQYSFSSPLWDLTRTGTIISQDGRVIALNPTNSLQGSLVQLRGAKTGVTDIAGGNLLVLLEQPIGRPIGVVVLGSTHEGRFSDVALLLGLLRQNTIR